MPSLVLAAGQASPESPHTVGLSFLCVSRVTLYAVGWGTSGLEFQFCFCSKSLGTIISFLSLRFSCEMGRQYCIIRCCEWETECKVLTQHPKLLLSSLECSCPCVHLQALRRRRQCPIPLHGFCRSELRSSCFHGGHSTDSALSPLPVGVSVLFCL